MKYISVCSGIEAATVAWHGLGWEPLAFGEIDAFPSAVLSHHYPEVPNLGDMSKFREWPEELLVECDLLVGGTPCQAFSVAGLRKSLEDDRGNLSLVYVQLFHHINEVRKRHGRQPAIALWENVPGVLSTRDNAFGCFVSGLLGVDDTIETQDGKWPKAGFLGSEAIRVGYRVLDAQYFAVAQRRRRVFLVAVPCELVASLGGRACPSEILSLRESVLGNPPTRGAAWEGAARPTAASLTGSGRGVERCGESRGQDDVVVACPPCARTLTQRMHKGFDSTLDSQTPIVSFKPGQSEAAGGTFVTEEFAPTIQGQNNGSTAVPAVAFKPSHYTRGKDGEPDEVAPPVSADADKGYQDTLVMRQPVILSNDPAHAICYNEQRTYTNEGSVFQLRNVVACVTGPRTHALTTRAAVEEDGTGRGTPIIPAVFTKSKRAQSENDDESWVPGEVAPTQNQFDVGDTRATTVVAFRDPSPTVTAKMQGSSGWAPYDEDQHLVGVGASMSVRRLTPRECEFLQGFPPDYTLVTHRNKPAADGPRYRALGNSMAVPCMAWLGWRIHKATGEEP